MKKLTYPDVAAIAVSWTGGSAITLIVNDPVVAIVAIIFCFILTKHVIYKEKD